ncbi:MAG: hypothetical protein CFH16_01315 [Alphaproteobacteria bacterium MarineAlpha5_Bin6]|nr:MAG: hypothetical protein CFH16_01315 [Alphaproteobacteria bacterium MarineAlpha5_Bin6]|tara:strand:+ start:3599 stop:4060 length:462 start_codon:yes stop_codon:yes gene_type:complete
MYSKKNGRVTFRSNRRQPFKKYSNFSNGKIRNKGNLSQQYQKYLKLAKEASSSGDRIQTEYYYQFADHYFRTMTELGIVVEDNENPQQVLHRSESDQINDENAASSKEISSNDSVTNETQVKESEDDPESIESVPFISEPAKKKTTKSKKEAS